MEDGRDFELRFFLFSRANNVPPPDRSNNVSFYQRPTFETRYKKTTGCVDGGARGQLALMELDRLKQITTHMAAQLGTHTGRTFYHSGPTWCPRRPRLVGRPRARALFHTRPLDYSFAICALTLLFCSPGIQNADPRQLPAISAVFSSIQQTLRPKRPFLSIPGPNFTVMPNEGSGCGEADGRCPGPREGTGT